MEWQGWGSAALVTAVQPPGYLCAGAAGTESHWQLQYTKGALSHCSQGRHRAPRKHVAGSMLMTTRPTATNSDMAGQVEQVNGIGQE